MSPSAKLTLVAGDRNAQAARLFFPNARIWTFRNNIFSRLFLWARLWAHSFDAVIDLHSYPFSTTSALMSVISGCRVRVGFWATGDFLEYEALSKKVFNHGMKAPSEGSSEITKSFLLVRKLVPSLKDPKRRVMLPSLPGGVADRANEFFEKTGIVPNDRVIGIHPTLRKLDNRWSPAKYLELIALLSKVPRLKFVVIHGKDEKAEVESFRSSVRPFSNVFIAPASDLFFILGIAKRFDVLACGDSGLMHACSWVTRVAAVFGPSDPRRWGPSPLTGFRHKVFRKKDRDCDSIKAGEVAAELKKMLSKRRF